MHETPAELRDLQVLLDDCRADAGTHLRSIFRDERRMSAAQVVRELAGVFVLHVATVTAQGAPLLAPIDGLFYRSRFWIGFPPGSVRGRHLRTRPAVSASYSKGEDVCILVHGEAREVPESDAAYGAFEDYGRECYGAKSWDYWAHQHYQEREGPGFTAWIDPRRMYAMKAAPA